MIAAALDVSAASFASALTAVEDPLVFPSSEPPKIATPITTATTSAPRQPKQPAAALGGFGAAGFSGESSGSDSGCDWRHGRSSDTLPPRRQNMWGGAFQDTMGRDARERTWLSDRDMRSTRGRSDAYGTQVSVQARHRRFDSQAALSAAAVSVRRHWAATHNPPPTANARPAGTAPDTSARIPTSTTASAHSAWDSTAAGCARSFFSDESDGRLAQYDESSWMLVDPHFELRHFIS